MIDNEGNMGKEVNHRIQAGWNSWKKASGCEANNGVWNGSSTTEEDRGKEDGCDREQDAKMDERTHKNGQHKE